MSSMALSPRLSKKELEPYLTSNFDLSISIFAAYSFPALVTSKEILSVLPLMVMSPVTVAFPSLNFVLFVITKLLDN